jgi:hypothetical protein
MQKIEYEKHKLMFLQFLFQDELIQRFLRQSFVRSRSIKSGLWANDLKSKKEQLASQ